MWRGNSVPLSLSLSPSLPPLTYENHVSRNTFSVGLAKAGVREWSFAEKRHSAKRVVGNENSTFDKTWSL